MSYLFLHRVLQLIFIAFVAFAFGQRQPNIIKNGQLKLADTCSRIVKGLHMEMFERQPSTDSFDKYHKKCMNGRSYYQLYAGDFMHSSKRLKSQCRRKILRHFKYILHERPTTKVFKFFMVSCTSGDVMGLLRKYLMMGSYKRKHADRTKDPFERDEKYRPSCHLKTMVIYQATINRDPNVHEYVDVMNKCLHRTPFNVLYIQIKNSVLARRVNCISRTSHFSRYLYGRYPSLADYREYLQKCMTMEPHIIQLKRMIDSEEFTKRYKQINPIGI